MKPPDSPHFSKLRTTSPQFVLVPSDQIARQAAYNIVAGISPRSPQDKTLIIRGSRLLLGIVQRLTERYLTEVRT